MNIIYFLFFMSRMNHKSHVELLNNNANLDFEDYNTTVRFKHYKKMLEERKEKLRKQLNYW